MRVQGVDFFVGDILDSSTVKLEFADVVTCTGVLSIFDDFTPIIENLISWCKPGGKIFVHSLFSDYPFDVRITYSPTEKFGEGLLESGWNIFSKETVGRFLESKLDAQVISQFEFHEFSMKSQLHQQSDLIRSWTIEGADGNLILTNGLNLLQPHAILEISK